MYLSRMYILFSEMSHSSMLVPLIVPMECDDVQLTDQNNSDKECLNVITHSNSSCSSEEITSLSLGKVIALDAKLEHFLQVCMLAVSDTDICISTSSIVWFLE